VAKRNQKFAVAERNIVVTHFHHDDHLRWPDHAYPRLGSGALYLYPPLDPVGEGDFTVAGNWVNVENADLSEGSHSIMSIKRVLLNSSLALASSALTLTAIEVALRLLDKPAWDTELRAGWKSTGADGYFNELGYRGKAIHYTDRDIVIVLLGDSQVQSTGCPPGWMPEQFLENYLGQFDARYKVFTLGSRGYGNDQEYLALKQYFRKYRANAVVLWQTLSNDVWNNVFPTNSLSGTIKPTYWLDNGTLKGPNYQLDEVISKPARTKIGVMLNRLLRQRSLDRGWERYLPTPYQPLTHYEGSFVRDWDPYDADNKNLYLKFPLSAGVAINLSSENLKNEKSHFSVQLYPRSKRMQYGLDLTRKLLRSINDLASEHDSSFFIFYVLAPEDQQRLKNEEADEVIVHKRDGLFYQTSFRQTMANMAYVNEGFTTFAIPILLETWKISDIDRHLNCAANDQVMRVLASKIAEHLQDSK
jgi:hypothetical protein